ncbi:hypothetical protein RHGRI_014077 [Rhododendron griersonianum]|uniref:Uncharacterized protein n=1 Tax=Rhododendron griersonianum TaxID=479676 RepID=A0AAV6K7Z4_9ERIC|nr:hypothetical protein RHGRI_014077 [Rhododendron griersonianum]
MIPKQYAIPQISKLVSLTKRIIDLQNDQFLVKQHCNETKESSLQVRREASDNDFMDGRQPRKEVFGLSELSCKVY